MVVVGLSCHDHDAAACLVRDGVVVAAALEAWFDRKPHSPSFPAQALNYCLLEAGVTIDGVDRVALSNKPFLEFERILMSHVRAFPRSLGTFLQEVPPWLEQRLVLPVVLRKEHGYEGKVHFLHHHLCHAASAYLPGPFDEAAILVTDGAGEWSTASLGHGEGTSVTLRQRLRYPHSIGLFYTAIATYLGFEPLDGEARVMALSRTGRPALRKQLETAVHIGEDGSVRIDTGFFQFFEGERLYSHALEELLGPARAPGDPVVQHHRDTAASAQALLEEAIVRAARGLHAQTGSDRLCLAGGVAANTLAVRRLLQDTPFTDIHIPPEPGNAGSAMGAALYLSHALQPDLPRRHVSRTDFGPASPAGRLEVAVKNSGRPFRRLDVADRGRQIARRLADGDIIGWYQGRMSFARADLGRRAVLIDPRVPGANVRLGHATGHLEPIPPVEVCVSSEHVAEVFGVPALTSFKHLEADLCEPWRDLVPAPAGSSPSARLLAVHREDNRPLHDLLEAFHAIADIPMLLCAGLARGDGPVACSPSDALDIFGHAPIDALVLEDWVVERGVS